MTAFQSLQNIYGVKNQTSPLQATPHGCPATTKRTPFIHYLPKEIEYTHHMPRAE
jgi:hypothetical protein